MNSININKSNISSIASTDNKVENANLSSQNPIVSQPGSLGIQKKSEKNRTIQSSSDQKPPIASDTKLKGDIMIRLEKALEIENPMQRDLEIMLLTVTAQNTLEVNEKDAVRLEIAKNTQIDISGRTFAAKEISDLSKKDDALLEICKDTSQAPVRNTTVLPRPLPNEFEIVLFSALESISDLEKKDQAALSITQNNNLNFFDRINIAQSIKNPAIQDQAWSYIAQDHGLRLRNRKAATENIQDNILRDKTLTQLYNDAINLNEEEAALAEIINRIQDPELQALAREALLERKMVRLNFTKSARNVLE